MKLIISLFFILILTSFNSNAVDTPAETFDKQLENYIKGKDNKLPDIRKLNSIQLNEFIKKNKLNNNFVKKEKEFDISKFRGVIWVIVIIFIIIFSNSGFTGFDEEEGRVKKKKLKDTNQSKIDEFLRISNKKNTDKEREDEFSYDEEDLDSEMQQKANEDFLSELYSGDLKIKVEEKIDNKNTY